MLSVMVIMAVLELPFGLYHTFVIEQRYGFNRTTLGVFAGDLIKQFILMLVIGGPILAIALCCRSRQVMMRRPSVQI